MAKSRRTRRGYYRRKGRWSANLSEVRNETIQFPVSGVSSYSLDLCVNPPQTNTTVSQQYTVKNVYFNFQLETNAESSFSNIEGLTAYIMYVPQGMTVNELYPLQHPEYIMAMRFYGSPEFESTAIGSVRNPLSIRTRLARRLQTGDKVIFLLLGQNTGSVVQNLQINGVIRWWTKAN